MKTYHILSVAVGLLFSLPACKKSNQTSPSATGAINVTNAVIGGATLTLIVPLNIVSTNNTLAANTTGWFPLVGGDVPVSLGIPGVPATKSTPAIQPVLYFSRVLPVTPDINYSLFLSGIAPAQIDTILINETYPRTYADSICGVRFINLAPGSSPISVNIQGAAYGSEVTGLGYKAYSNFIQHPAKAANPSYVFEFRDAGTGALITTYTLTTPFFHNVTLALTGIVGGSPAAGVILDYDY